MPLMTKAEYARHRGCSKAHITQSLSRIGAALVIDEKTGREVIDSEIADDIFAATKDPSRYLGKNRQASLSLASEEGAAPFPLSNPETFETTKTAREKVKLEHERILLAERKGETLPREGVVAAGARAAQQLREALKQRNQEMAEKFATMTDTRAILIAMEESDRGLLEVMHDEFIRRATGESRSQQGAVN